MRPAMLATLVALALAGPALAADAPPKRKSAAEIIDAAPASAWRDLDPANTLYMELPTGRVVIELAPGFAPEHVANIRTMARGRFWDGLTIYRAQDNFVVQFGDPEGEEAGKAKPYPAGTKTKLPAEFTRDSSGVAFDRLPDIDGWAPQVGFIDGMPVGHDPKTGKAWLAHCYGVVGAGRNNAPDSSIGAELYVVTGQSPRQLDRNITVVGRVIRGMELLSAIRRGPPPMGFHEDPAQRTPIAAITLASTLPEAQRERIEVLRTDTPTFDALVESRRNRTDDFYHRPAGHIDLCNIAIPVRTPDEGGH